MNFLHKILVFHTIFFVNIFKFKNLYIVGLLVYCIVHFGETVTDYDSIRNKLALEAFQEHYNTNIVVSPLLLRLPLCKLVSFARGSARQELLSGLGIKTSSMPVDCFSPVKEVMSYFDKVNLITSTKIIVNYTDDFKQTFLSNNPDFGVKVMKVSYLYPKTSVSYINKGVESTSYKRITEILEPSDINNQTSIMLLSVACFKVTWELPFDVSLTRPAKFYHQDGKISTVSMMSKSDSYYYSEDEIHNIQVVNTKLASFGLTMTLVVPRSSRGLAALLRKLSDDPDFLKGIYKRMRVDNVRVVLPRFKIKSTLDWENVLNKIGIAQIFNKTNSGLDDILNNNSNIKHAYLSKCKQKTFIDIDEMGAYRGPKRASPVDFDQRYPKAEIVANHPFYFTINVHRNPAQYFEVDELFSGVYYGPDT